jgi:3-oxoadipate enol-lactonase
LPSERHVVALHHVRSGAAGAPVLVLGGSLGTTLAMWDPVLERLERERSVLRFDHRGHGDSPPADPRSDIADLGGDVLALLDRLGLERVSYAGVSLGGMVGMWLAAHAPERIERLVCICTSAHIPPAQAWADRAAAVLDAGSVAAVSDAVLARWFTPAYAAARPDVISWIGDMLRACPAEAYAALCGVVERLDLRGDLAAIAAPTLVIAAAEDSSTPPEHAERIVAAIPGATLEVLPHGAHLAVIERADEVLPLLERHLQDAVSGEAGRRAFAIGDVTLREEP